MGNNPSRPPQQQQQQQQQQQHHHQHQHQHHLFHHASHSSPTSTHPSPPAANLPTRAVSNASDASRIKGARRNSLQPPASIRHQPTSLPTGVAPQYEDHLSARNSDPRYILQPRRESIAETISGSGANANWTPKLLPDDDDTSLKTPMMVPIKHAALGTPLTIATGTVVGNEDVSPGSVLPPSVAGAVGADIMPRRGSMASTATIDEDDVDVADTRTIPTLIQWPHVNEDRVYVTGTFSNWRKRFKLSRSATDDTWSAIVPLPPGTHHLKFIVDGDMRTSDALPTAVDHTGILVNYLEVNADDMPPLGRQLTPESLNSSNAHPHGHHHTDHPPHQQNIMAALARTNKRYTNEIPGYLREFVDGYGDDDADSHGSRRRRIGTNDGDIPVPPSLPMMLQKVILNTNGAMKDDASVLNIPNHVVLNHLATSSIKQQVLAVSATTRYRKKYVTTILYKATTE